MQNDAFKPKMALSFAGKVDSLRLEKKWGSLS